jgi:hypothetical protein
LFSNALEQSEASDIVEALKKICDQITEEESKNQDRLKFIYGRTELIPKGPNIFLALPAPGRVTNEIAVLTLEREYKDAFFCGLYVGTKVTGIFPGWLKKCKVWTINEVTPDKILTVYANIYKTLQGK